MILKPIECTEKGMNALNSLQVNENAWESNNTCENLVITVCEAQLKYKISSLSRVGQWVKSDDFIAR